LKMRDALEDTSRRIEGLRRTFDDKAGHPTWPHHPATLAALVRRGLLEPREVRNRKGYRVQAWFITDAGRRALEPVLVIKRDVPLYLAPVSGRTSNPGRAVDYDRHPVTGRLMAVEALNPPSPDWQERAEAHRRLARADTDAVRLSGLTHPEERLAELRRMAAERGISISSELRLVERGLASLERKLRREAA
jgi:hypothetical protein